MQDPIFDINSQIRCRQETGGGLLGWSRDAGLWLPSGKNKRDNIEIAQLLLLVVVPLLSYLLHTFPFDNVAWDHEQDNYA